MSLESIITFNKAFPELVIDEMPVLNVSPRIDWQLEKADAAYLRAKNALDYEIYDYARGLLVNSMEA